MDYFILSLLLILLLAGAWLDFHTYRICNSLTLSGTLFAVFFNSVLPNGIGLLNSLAGLGMGLALLLPFYLLRIMAAGDVKFMAMAGAFLGSSAMVDVLLYTMVAGGILAFLLAWRRKVLPEVFQKPIEIPIPINAARNDSHCMPDSQTATQIKSQINSQRNSQSNSRRLPYGIAIAAGSIFYLFSNLELLAA